MPPLVVDAPLFRQQGYFLAKGILPPEVVARVLEDLNTVVVQQLHRLRLPTDQGAEPSAVYSNLTTLFDADLKAYLASLSLTAKMFSVHAMVMHAHIARAMTTLGIALPVFQTAPVLHLMSNRLKVPGGYSGVGVHQDWPALQGSLDTITIWIPLVDVSADLFPLEIIPGSHQLGLCQGRQTEHIHEVDPSCYDESSFVPVTARRGDALLFSTFLIHRSGQQGKEGVRIAISARYENAAEPTFVNRLYPFAQKRVVQRELIVEGFPSRDEVAKIYEPLPHTR